MQDVKDRLTPQESAQIQGFFMDLIISIVMGFQMPVADLEQAIEQAKTNSSLGYKTFSQKIQSYIDMAYMTPLKKTVAQQKYE